MERNIHEIIFAWRKNIYFFCWWQNHAPSALTPIAPEENEMFLLHTMKQRAEDGSNNNKHQQWRHRKKTNEETGLSIYCAQPNKRNGFQTGRMDKGKGIKKFTSRHNATMKSFGIEKNTEVKSDCRYFDLEVEYWIKTHFSGILL